MPRTNLDHNFGYETVTRYFEYENRKFMMIVSVDTRYNDSGHVRDLEIILNDVIGESPFVDEIPDDLIEHERKRLENAINENYDRLNHNIQNELTKFFNDLGCTRSEYLSELNGTSVQSEDCCSGNSCGCHHGAD